MISQVGKSITEQQQLFLEKLSDSECRGDIRLAMSAAGFHPKAKVDYLLSDLKNEIVEATTFALSSLSMAAAYNLNDIMVNPTQAGARHKLNAATAILDRVGFAKQSHTLVNITASKNTPLFILPAKNGSA
mgnify:CR=1 FL=1